MYQELAEGGATRFMAIFSPATATEVGPVRSVREADVELVRQFGKIALGSSGGNGDVLATMNRAAAAGQLLDANFDRTPGAYRRAEKRKDAYNFYTSPALIDQARPGGDTGRDIGLRFGPAPAGMEPAGRASIRFSPITRVSVVFDPETGRYDVFQDGDRMPGFRPANVVVQHVAVRDSPHVDAVGNRTPYTETVGGGAVSVLRSGMLLPGGWARPSAEVGTKLFDAARADLPLEVGPTLFLLVPGGAELQVG